MKRDQFSKILFEELDMLGEANIAGLHKTIDASKLWDGYFDELMVRRTESTRYRAVCLLYQLDILLSIGRLRIEYATNDTDDVIGFEFSYHVPEVTRWFQPLYRNRLERTSYDPDSWDTEIKLQRFVVKRFNSLLDGMAKWFADSNVNIKKFDKSFQPDQTGYHTMLNFLMGAAGRARLCAELHKQRVNDLGMNTNADRISMLANQLVEEVRIQLDSNSVFAHSQFNEYY